MKAGRGQARPRVVNQCSPPPFLTEVCSVLCCFNQRGLSSTILKISDHSLKNGTTKMAFPTSLEKLVD